ncbi:AraC family transcriptional regulator [Streptomyces glaucus]|uniref:Helix-turn-helix domain-containing protein n=1 Tax=Streptomyces glaucus TaxID=284029 RepID=A0ABP5WGE8_9ACTN
MIGTTFRSENVPAGVRFDAWRELLDRSRSSESSSDHATDFWAECRLMELGPVTVLPLSCAPTRYWRDAQMIRRSAPERFHLSLLLQGDMTLVCDGRAETFRPGDLHLVDSSRPYDLRLAADHHGRVITGIGVDLPKVLLPLPPHRIRELLGRRLPGREGVGALLTQFITGLERQADSLQSTDAPRLGTVVLDLLSAWFAQLLDANTALTPETQRNVLEEHILTFIRQNLHDPELTPPVIAAAHHISLSYLHRVFRRSQGETVAAWIRGQRLEAARRDLADPALRGTPIYAIAARWGLPRASDFTRAFLAAYGSPPSEFRHQALSAFGHGHVPETCGAVV